MALYWFVLALCVSLSPSSQPILRHGQLATAVTEVLDAEGPLFAGDVDRHRSAALMVAIAFRESSLDTRAVGDHGRSFGAFQLHASSGGAADILDDPHAQALVAHRMIRQSMRIDRDYPIAFYARGPRYTSIEAQRLSNDRVSLAKRLAALGP